jgi:outer membrane protein assembly factor BamB
MKPKSLGLLGITVTFVLALISIPRAEAADTILYGSTGNLNSNGGGRLYSIDVTTQSVTLIGNTGFDRLGGIAFNSSGVLYGASGGSIPGSTLLTIDPNTGMATVVGLISDRNIGVDGLRFDSQNNLYGAAFDGSISTGVLVTIDPSNANVLTSVTLMGSGNSFAAGIAFSSAGTLYGSRGNSAGHLEDLDLINQGTGQMTPIGSMTAVISDIAFSLDGTLYGSSPNGDLYSINPVSGDKTFLFNTGINSLSGLTTAVPEPSTFLLLAIAAAVFFVVMRCRARRSPSD